MYLYLYCQNLCNLNITDQLRYISLKSFFTQGHRNITKFTVCLHTAFLRSSALIKNFLDTDTLPYLSHGYVFTQTLHIHKKDIYIHQIHIPHYSRYYVLFTE